MTMKRTFLALLMILGVCSTYSQDYFPLIKGSYWIYKVYQDGVLSYSDSTLYQDEAELNDTTFYLFVHHYIENNTISSTDTFFLYENYSDNNAIMLSNRNQPIIDSAVYAKHTYEDGEWWIAHKIPQDDTIKVESIGDLTVSAGTFNNCFMQGDEYIFASNVGIIKILLWNETSYFDLVRYHIPSSTGINKTTKQNFQVFPNPSNDIIKIPNMVNSNYRIVKPNGQIIKTGIISNTNVDISELKPGIYIIDITKERKRYSTRFVKN